MPDKTSNLVDLSPLTEKFNKILTEKNLQEQKEPILKLLNLVLLGQMSSVNMALQLGKELKLNFSQSADLAFALKKEIIDQKSQISIFKNLSASQFWTKDNPNLLADEFLDKYDYDLPEEILKKRFYSGILSWIRGIRDLNELKDFLMRSRKIGGAEMPEEVWPELEEFLQAKALAIKESGSDLSSLITEAEAESAKLGLSKASPESAEMIIDSSTGNIAPLSQAKEDFTGGAVHINQLLEVKGIKSPAGKLPVVEEKKVAEPPYNLAQEIIKEEEFLESKEELAPPPPVRLPQPPKPATPAAKPSFTPPSYIPPQAQANNPPLQVPVQPLKFSPPPSINKPPQVTKEVPIVPSRPKIEDVKSPATRVYGPLEELGSLSLADFRRLAAEPQQAADKIKDKLGLLEDESITQKIEGIKALKASPLYKTYAEIMNKSMMQGLPLEQVISQLNTLNKGEFQAIMDLNKSLKY